MSTAFASLFEALAAPFGADEIKQVQKAGGRRLDYITARTAIGRDA